MLTEMTALRLTLSALILALTPLGAQEGPPRIAVSLYAFGYAPGHQDVHLRTGPEGYAKVELSTANIVGPVMSLLTEGKLTVHGEPTPSAEGGTTYPVIGSATLPSGLRRALVVLLPDPENKQTPYRTLVIEHDPEGFPLGTYRLINLSTHPIRGAVGRSIVRAEPGGLATLEPKGEPGSVLPVRFEYHANERWNRLTETRCAVRKDRRWLMCVYRDPKTRRLNIRSIPDRTATPTGPE